MVSVQLLRAMLWPTTASSCAAGTFTGSSAEDLTSSPQISFAKLDIPRWRIRAANAVTARGVTPLQVACEGGNAAAAQLLLQAGADPNASDSLGRGPLVKAVLGAGSSRCAGTRSCRGISRGIQLQVGLARGTAAAARQPLTTAVSPEVLAGTNATDGAPGKAHDSDSDDDDEVEEEEEEKGEAKGSAATVPLAQSTRPQHEVMRRDGGAQAAHVSGTLQQPLPVAAAVLRATPDESRYAAVIAVLAAAGCQYHPRALFVCPTRLGAPHLGPAEKGAAHRLAAAAAQRLRAAGRGLNRLRRAASGSDCMGVSTGTGLGLRILHAHEERYDDFRAQSPAWPLPCRARESPLHVAVEQRQELLVAALLSAYPFSLMTGVSDRAPGGSHDEADDDDGHHDDGDRIHGSGEENGGLRDHHSPAHGGAGTSAGPLERNGRRHSFSGPLRSAGASDYHHDDDGGDGDGDGDTGLLAPQAATPCLTSPRFKKLLRTASALPGALAPAAAAAVERVQHAAAAASCRCSKLHVASAPGASTSVASLQSGATVPEDASSAPAGGAGQPRQPRALQFGDAADAADAAATAVSPTSAAAQAIAALMTMRSADSRRRLMAQLSAPPPPFQGCCACQRKNPLAICAEQLAQAAASGEAAAASQVRPGARSLVDSPEMRIALMLIAAGCEPREGDLTSAGRSPLQHLLGIDSRMWYSGCQHQQSRSLVDDSDADTEDALAVAHGNVPRLVQQEQEQQIAAQLRQQGVDVRRMADFLSAVGESPGHGRWREEGHGRGLTPTPADLPSEAMRRSMADFLATAPAMTRSGQLPLSLWTCDSEDWPPSPAWRLRPEPVSHELGSVTTSWLAEAAWRRRRHVVAAYFAPFSP